MARLKDATTCCTYDRLCFQERLPESSRKPQTEIAQCPINYSTEPFPAECVASGRSRQQRSLSSCTVMTVGHHIFTFREYLHQGSSLTTRATKEVVHPR